MRKQKNFLIKIMFSLRACVYVCVNVYRHMNMLAEMFMFENEEQTNKYY